MANDEFLVNMIMREDGVFEEYDESLDITIHFTSLKERDDFILNELHRMRWITDRDPSPEEVEQAGDVGFILCISGQLGNAYFDHAIEMQNNYFEDGRWFLRGARPNKTFGLRGDEHDVYKVHGWMLPPSWGWEEAINDEKSETEPE